MSTLIGLGVTIHKRGKSEAYTVISQTKSGKTLTIQRDKVTLLKKPTIQTSKKGKSATMINPKDIQYLYEQDRCGKIYKIRHVKNGYWKLINENDHENDVQLGVRSEINYMDL